MEKIVKIALWFLAWSGIILPTNRVVLPEINLIMTGDVNLGRSVNYQIKKTNNPCFPFEKIADFLKEADLTLINLESVLFKNCHLTQEGMRLCGDPNNVNGLICAGVDVASLANNHQKDFGQNGLEQTISLLTSNNIAAIDQGQTVFRQIKGVRFAFLAFDLIGHSVDKNEIEEKIKNAKSATEVVVVIFHWGEEYQANPNQTQYQLGHLAIDSGADLVLGNHPHWVQPAETYQDKLIVYSHGNFIFDQQWSEKTKEGLVGKYTFRGNKLASFELISIKINNFFQPNIVE